MLIELARGGEILVGKLGYIYFPKAFYAYVGSAMNGLEARLAHHLRKEKKNHWHIDYLLKEAKLLEVILCPSEQRMECSLAQALARNCQSIPNFGAADCRCSSHLYFGDDRNRLKVKVREAADLAGLDIENFVMEGRSVIGT